MSSLFSSSTCLLMNNHQVLRHRLSIVCICMFFTPLSLSSSLHLIYNMITDRDVPTRKEKKSKIIIAKKKKKFKIDG